MAINKDRIIEIENEGLRRLNLWLKYSTFDDMTLGGSLMRFDMALGMMGYPFEKEKWMGKDFKKFISLKEYESDEYEKIIYKLFEKTENGK